MHTDSVEMTLDLLQHIRDRDAQIGALRQCLSVALELLAERDKELETARARTDAIRSELRWLMTGERPADRVDEDAAA